MKFTAGKPEQVEFVVPNGDYDLVVVEASEDTSKKGGNDIIEMLLQIIHPDGSKGPKLYDYLTWTDKSFWRIDQFLKSAGHHPGEGSMIDINAADIIGWKVRATLSQGTTNKGKPRMEVDAYKWEKKEEFIDNFD
jgi:hypothetical protein